MSDHLEDEIVHRELDRTEPETAAQIAEIVAELDGERYDELTTMYEHVDHILDHMFSTPPSPKAQVEITFSYSGYRITVEQNGRARFVRL